MKLTITPYQDSDENMWDRFVNAESINGTFLQSRKFLNYHPKDRFTDHSLLIKNGNQIAAVVPACEILVNEKKTLYSHKGSTFGGIVISSYHYNVDDINMILVELEQYAKEHKIEQVIMKLTPHIFTKCNTELLEYMLFKEGYDRGEELSFYIDFDNYNKDIISNFHATRRRDYKYSLKNDLTFEKLETKEEISKYYEILKSNLQKFKKKPVHTLDELMDFKNNRLKGITSFYGVFKNGIMLAGSMIFKFDNRVYHTQQLVSNVAYQKLYPMEFLVYHLITEASVDGYRNFSFGISTEENGTVLNYGLSRFKAGFGAKYTLNPYYVKRL